MSRFSIGDKVRDVLDGDVFTVQVATPDSTGYIVVADRHGAYVTWAEADLELVPPSPTVVDSLTFRTNGRALAIGEYFGHRTLGTVRLFSDGTADWVPNEEAAS